MAHYESIRQMQRGLPPVMPTQIHPSGYTYPGMLGGRTPIADLRAMKESFNRFTAPSTMPKPGDTFVRDNLPSSERSTNPGFAHDKYVRPYLSPDDKTILYLAPNPYELCITCSQYKPISYFKTGFSILTESSVPEEVDNPFSHFSEEGRLPMPASYSVRDYGNDRITVASMPTVDTSYGNSPWNTNVALARAELAFRQKCIEEKTEDGFTKEGQYRHYTTRSPARVWNEHGFAIDGAVREAVLSKSNPNSVRLLGLESEQGPEMLCTIVDGGPTPVLDYHCGEGTGKVGRGLGFMLARFPVTSETKFISTSKQSFAGGGDPFVKDKVYKLQMAKGLTIYPLQLAPIALPAGVKAPSFDFFKYEVTDPLDSSVKTTFYDGLFIPYGSIFFSGKATKSPNVDYHPPPLPGELKPVRDMAIVEEYPRLHVTMETFRHTF